MLLVLLERLARSLAMDGAPVAAAIKGTPL